MPRWEHVFIPSPCHSPVAIRLQLLLQEFSKGHRRSIVHRLFERPNNCTIQVWLPRFQQNILLPFLGIARCLPQEMHVGGIQLDVKWLDRGNDWTGNGSLRAQHRLPEILSRS